MAKVVIVFIALRPLPLVSLASDASARKKKVPRE